MVVAVGGDQARECVTRIGVSAVPGDLTEWSVGGLGGGVHAVALRGEVSAQVLGGGALARATEAVQGDEDATVPSRHVAPPMLDPARRPSVALRAYCSRDRATRLART